MLKFHVVALAALAAALSVAEAAQTASFEIKTGSKTATTGLGVMKIIGGDTSSIKKRPFMAEILIQNGKQLNPQCGATILDKRHILSAAHCFTNRSLAYKVRVGSDKWASGGQLVSVKRIYTSSQYYKKAAYDYDVAVLRVSPDLKLGQSVKAVSLVPIGQKVVANTEITLIGWGYTDVMHEKPLPAALREVQIETIDASECSSDYSSYELTVTDRMFCGMGIDKDSCQGDSGGPVYNDKTGQQMGIISWGMGCAQMGSPGVFTNLANKDIRAFVAQSQKR